MPLWVIQFSSSRQVSHEWLACLWEYNRSNNRNNALSPKTITAFTTATMRKQKQLTIAVTPPQLSGFGFEGLSIFISHTRWRAHTNLYIDIQHLNTQKQTRKWFSFQSMTVLRVIFIAVTIIGIIKKSNTYGSSHFFIVRCFVKIH